MQNYTFFIFFVLLFQPYFLSLSSRAVPLLHTTSERLGAVAAYDKRYAAHKILKFHRPFMRATAAIAPTQRSDLTEGKPPVGCQCIIRTVLAKSETKVVDADVFLQTSTSI